MVDRSLLVVAIFLAACSRGTTNLPTEGPAAVPDTTSLPQMILTDQALRVTPLATPQDNLLPTSAAPGVQTTAISATLTADLFTLSTAIPDQSGELFSDRFDRSGSGWDIYSSLEANANYVAGEYILGVDVPRTRTLGLPRGMSFDNTVIYVSARRQSGPENAGFGIVCRYRNDDNYHFFLVTADSYAIIGKRADGKLTGLSSEFLLPIDSLLPGDAPNLLTASCVEDQLAFWVNAKFVASVQDPDMLETGVIGLLGTAFDEPGVRVAFDDLTVYAP